MSDLITSPEKEKEFRKALMNRIKKAGAEIVRYGKFNQATIARENALTNELVSEYLLDGLEVSVEFVVENEQLFLEIIVSQI